jgi:2,4-dienoyl-CoA reductase-like NADH-dependent reductase (Old Yellow Enzyme family)
MFEFDHLEAAGNAIIPASAPFAGERFDAFRALAIEGKRHGALFVGQVSHAGRQVQENLQQNPLSASDVHLKVSNSSRVRKLCLCQLSRAISWA